MTPAKVPVAAASKKNFLFFAAAALFYMTAAMQVFSASRSHLHPTPGNAGMFWIMAALNGCLGTVVLIRGISAHKNARSA